MSCACDREKSMYASEVFSMVRVCPSKHKCWWQRHSRWRRKTCRHYVGKNRSCLVAIPVFFSSPKGHKIGVVAAIAGVKGG